MTKRELNSQQLEAARLLERNVALSAGAGTGKTSTLVERFLTILKTGAAGVSQIAAITFTEKAANELKGRIYKELRDAAEDASDPALRLCRRRDLIGLQTAQIGTIHAFCSGILREFALQAGVDPAFDVIEAIDAAMLAASAVRDCLFAAVEDGLPEARRLLDVFEFKALSLMIEGALDRRADMSFVSHTFQLARTEPARLADVLKRENSSALIEEAVEKAFSGELRKLLSELQGLEGPDGDSLEAKRRAVLAASARLRQDAPQDLPAAIESICDALSSPSRGSGKKWGGEFDRVKDVMKELKALLEPLTDAFDAVRKEDWPRRARELLDFARLYDDCLAVYAWRKRESGVLDFDDLVILARDLVVSQKAVAEALARRYRFILVDEFQDTDFAQAELVEAIASGGAKLFVVGDRQQSIYSFRGARVEVFSRLMREYREAGRGVLRRLDANQRTLGHVISFVNVLFGRLMPPRSTWDWRPSHEPLTAVRLAAARRVEFIVAASDRNMPYSRRIEAQEIARRIRAIVDSGLSVVQERTDDGGALWRGANYGDFAILFRSMSSVEIYERELRAADIPHYTVAGPTFYVRREIRDLINFLRFLVNADDSLSLVGVLRSTLFGISDDYLTELTARHSLADYLDQTPPAGDGADAAAFARAVGLIKRLRIVANRVPVHEIIDVIVEETSMLPALSMLHAGRQKVANVLKLRAAAAAFDSGSAGSIEDFVANLDLLELSQARESEALTEDDKTPVVRLMTIHAAKGLEFPIVVVADMGRRSSGGGRGAPVLIDRRLGIALPVAGDDDSACYQTAKRSAGLIESDEEMRILFVAMTRARDHLILSGAAAGRRGAMPTGAEGWAGQVLDALDIAMDAPGDYDFEGFTVEFSSPSSLEGAKPHRGGALLSLRDRLISGRRLPRARHGDRDAVLARCRPVGGAAAGRGRFTATELADFCRCPLRYELLHLRGLPADLILGEKDDSDRPAAHLLGLLLHEVLEKARPGETLLTVLERVLTANALYSSASRILRAECIPILARLEVSDFYRRVSSAADAYRERQFSFTLGGCLIEGKIDLCLSGEIVDFKSDDVSAGGAADYARAYRGQMDVYAIAYERLTESAPESVILYFLRPGVEVRWPYGAAGVRAAEERLSELIGRIHDGPPYAPAKDSSGCRCEYATLCSLISERRLASNSAEASP